MDISQDAIAQAVTLKPMTKPLHHEVLHPRPSAVDAASEAPEAPPQIAKIALPELEETDRQAIADFREDLMGAIGSNSFDAEALAASSPEALTTFAADQGVDLATLYADLDSHERLAPSEPSEEFKAFFDSLFEVAQSGEEADLAALAVDAPEEVVTIADVQGKDVEAVVAEMLQRINEVGDALDPMSLDPANIDPLAPPPPSAREEVDTFIDTIVAAVAADEVDVESLVAQAPQSLTMAASVRGTDLNAVVNELVDQIQTTGDPRLAEMPLEALAPVVSDAAEAVAVAADSEVTPAAAQAINAYQSEVQPSPQARAAVITMIMQA